MSVNDTVSSSASSIVVSSARSSIRPVHAPNAEIPNTVLLNMVAELTKKLTTPDTKAQPKSAATPAVRAPPPAGALPYHFPTPWGAHADVKLMDGTRKLYPNIFRTIGAELGRSDNYVTPFVDLHHLTPVGSNLLKENDARHSFNRASRSSEKGEVAGAPSVTPMLDASRRCVSAAWDHSKLAEFSLAAVDFALMLMTMVNPALAVPSLVMLRHALAVANGEHPSDWPHIVRFLETEMKNAVDPSGWPSLMETLATDVRRAGMDAAAVKSKPATPSATPDAPLPHVPRPPPAHNVYDAVPPAKPRDRESVCCKNWNRGVKCAEDDCPFTHRCSFCAGEHAYQHCPRRRDDGRQDNNRRDDRRGDDRKPRR